ncbi:DUF7341 domain-containing protein [Nocardia terpenica]
MYSTSEPSDLPTAAETLAYAVRELQDAIHALVEPRYEIHVSTANRVVRCRFRESVYVEMASELVRITTGRFSSSMSRSVNRQHKPRSRPPGWLDGIMWFAEVDRTVREWCRDPVHGNGPETVQRLNSVAARTFVQDDERTVRQWTQDLRRWTDRAHRLLRPERRWMLSAACPECGVRFIHRYNESGELVRQAALQLTVRGCTCQACKSTWMPDQFAVLANALKSPPTLLVDTDNEKQS